MMFNAGIEPQQFVIPAATSRIAWRKFIDTAADSPADIYPSLDGPPPPPRGRLLLEDHSMLVFIASDETIVF